MSPEEKARLEIDKKLEAAGWVIQDLSEVDIYASLGVAVRVPTFVVKNISSFTSIHNCIATKNHYLVFKTLKSLRNQFFKSNFWSIAKKMLTLYGVLFFYNTLSELN